MQGTAGVLCYDSRTYEAEGFLCAIGRGSDFIVECEMIHFVFRLIILMEDGFNPGVLEVS